MIFYQVCLVCLKFGGVSTLVFCKSLRVNGLRYSAVSSLQIFQQTRHTFVDYVCCGGVWMELESNGVSARCFMRHRGRRIGLRGHRGRQVRRPTAQSGRRSSARGLLCPLCACCVRAGWEIPYTECSIWCTGI